MMLFLCVRDVLEIEIGNTLAEAPPEHEIKSIKGPLPIISIFRISFEIMLIYFPV